MRLRLLCLISLAFLAACGERVSPDSDARILMMGDSMLATHRGTGQSVGDGLEDLLGEEVIDRSEPGARMIYVFPLSGSAGMRIAAQYRVHPWDWVVLNGGGNDLLFGCACALCETRLERMISEDGRTGVIPELVAALRAGGDPQVSVAARSWVERRQDQRDRDRADSQPQGGHPQKQSGRGLPVLAAEIWQAKSGPP